MNLQQFFKKKNTFKSTQGFSLIEVMIFASIISIVFIVAIAYVINLVRNMKINEHKILATYYAEDLREWLKSEKESDWDAFSQKAGFDDGVTGGNDPITYCFNNDIRINHTIGEMELDGDFPNQACTGYSGIINRSPLIFKREVKLGKDSSSAPTSVEAQIVVSWLESGTEYKVPINAKFTVWE